MQAILPVAALAGLTPDTGKAVTPTPSAVQLCLCDEIQISIVVVTAAVTLRPYYWMGGAWHALGGDGTSPLTPITGDPLKYGGTAEGRYSVPSGGTYWCLLVETGAVGNVSSALIGEHVSTSQ